MATRKQEELLEEGTYFNQMNKSELEEFLTTFQTRTQKRKREKAKKAYNKRKDARRNKTYSRKNREEEEFAL